MRTTKRRDAAAFASVEYGENGAPTAFLVWKKGENVTDHGLTIFSERSAKLLMAEQATRGNRYSMDINHLSLDKSAPLENQRAVGFYALEVRNGDLWICDCEWTATVLPGLQLRPPEWRFFSPAYDVDTATNEVVSFLNCALTNNPATHHVTSLASRVSKNRKVLAMKWSDIKAAIEGDDEDAKVAAYATIAAAFPDEEKKDAEGDEDAPESKKDAEDAPEKKDSDDDADKKDSAITAALDSKVRALETQLAAFKAESEAKERKALIAGRVMSAEMAGLLAKEPLATVRKYCATLPKKNSNPMADSANVQATRGAEQGSRASRLSPEEKAKLDEAMGLKATAPAIRREGTKQVFDTLTADQARKLLRKGDDK